jgi:hypothetical protein
VDDHGRLGFLLSGLIPGASIVAALLFIGYMFEVVDSLLVTQGNRYPTFDINRFGDYFMRGVWPFLSAMVASLVMVPLFLMLYFVFIGGTIAGVAAAGEDAAPFIAIPMMILFFVLIFAIVIGVNLLLTPMLLRAGLAQEFGEAFRWDWIKDFIKRMWMDILLAWLFMAISSTLLTLLGLLVCCVGVYAAQAVVLMAHAHLWYQLYAIYLTRGGAPVPIKPNTPPAPMMMPPQPM